MDVRAHVSVIFHLDKCIGCHTCSVACKNVWTDRPGAEYMWWNNVETKPGTGYPTKWEDQDAYQGGWELGQNGKLRLRSLSFALPANLRPQQVRVTSGGAEIASKHAVAEGTITIDLVSDLLLNAGQKIEVVIA